MGFGGEIQRVTKESLAESELGSMMDRGQVCAYGVSMYDS